MPERGHHGLDPSILGPDRQNNGSLRIGVDELLGKYSRREVGNALVGSSVFSVGRTDVSGAYLEASQDLLEVLPLPRGSLSLELCFKSFHPQALVLVSAHFSHMIDGIHPEMRQSICERCDGLVLCSVEG